MAGFQDGGPEARRWSIGGDGRQRLGGGRADQRDGVPDGVRVGLGFRAAGV